MTLFVNRFPFLHLRKIHFAVYFDLCSSHFLHPDFSSIDLLNPLIDHSYQDPLRQDFLFHHHQITRHPSYLFNLKISSLLQRQILHLTNLHCCLIFTNFLSPHLEMHSFLLIPFLHFPQKLKHEEESSLNC